jgi:RNA recognition motif-containing protein
MSDATRLAATIYISGLAPNLRAQDLHAAFIPFGDIADINLPKPDLAPGQSAPPPGVSLGHRGFGYVEFESAEDAAEAIDNMHLSELHGRTVRVAKAKPMRITGEGLGSKVALWEQVSYSALFMVEG